MKRGGIRARAWPVPWALAVVAVAILLATSIARAQSRPEIRASVDRDIVDVGGTIQLSLSMMSPLGMPSSPDPGATAGFSVQQRSVSPSQSISIVNGVRSDRQGITATWVLVAQRVGVFNIGPLSASVDGKRYSTERVSVRVVPKGQAPAPPQSQNPFGPGFSPFDPWKGLLNGFGDDDRLPTMPMPTGPPPDPRFALDAARGDLVFLHATVDKTRVVVGEQITYSVYRYDDEDAQGVEIQDGHEATAGDFVKRLLIENDGREKVVAIAEIAGHRYRVRLIRKAALFPLKSGDLEIGAMTLTFGRGNRSVVRDSERITVHVTEPPVAGRPPGYVIGDVGKFTLKADVKPRDVERGGAVAVELELAGTGNAPSSLTPPSRARAGIEWLEPEVHDLFAPGPNDKFGGRKTFSYIVHMNREGSVDLGAFALSYWDPDAKAYGTARADLGTVRVAAGASSPSSAPDKAAEVLPEMPAPISHLEGPRANANHLADRPLYWLGLFAAPLSYAGFFGVRGLGRRVRARLHASSTSKEAELRARIAAAEAATRGSDPRAAYAAIVRAMEAGTLARAQVNVRGIAVDDVARALEQAGVPPQVARAAQSVLDACGSARFSPDGDDIEAARKHWQDAFRILRSLKGA